ALAGLVAVRAAGVAVAAAFGEAGMIDKAVGMIPMIVATMKKSAEAAGIRAPEIFYPQVNGDAVARAVTGIAQSQAGAGPNPKLKAAAEQAAMQLRIES